MMMKKKEIWDEKLGRKFEEDENFDLIGHF